MPEGYDLARHDLEAFMRQVESELAAEYARISDRATEDPGTAGDEGEENWAAFLREWLPETYRVVTKGRILGVDGEASPQMDVIVLKSSYPPALLNKKVYLASGVAAAFECKTTLRKGHIEEAVSTASALQRLARPAPPRNTRQGTPYRELYGPIVYGLLAHSCAWSADTAVGHVVRALNKGVAEAAHPREVLDITCVADLGTWRTSKMSYDGPALNMWHLDEFREVLPNGYASCVVFGPDQDIRLQQSVPKSFPIMPVAQLCAYLTTRLAWEDESMRPMADYFRLVGLHGLGAGLRHPFALEAVYSDAVLQQLRGGRIDQEPWSQWRLMFM